MNTLRKILHKPRPDDWAPLAKFFYADEALNEIASELDTFDGRRWVTVILGFSLKTVHFRDPERCNKLVHKLRFAQGRVLHIIGQFFFLFLQFCEQNSEFRWNVAHFIPSRTRSCVARFSRQISRRNSARSSARTAVVWRRVPGRRLEYCRPRGGKRDNSAACKKVDQTFGWITGNAQG